MPRIQIKNRVSIKVIAMKPFIEKTALISITDHNWFFAALKNEPEYLIRIDFDDVDNDIFEDIDDETEKINVAEKYHIITDEQAKQIAEFYNRVKDKVDVIICQCEHGQSRSAAVAAAIMEYEQNNGIEIFADDSYYPNKVVYRKVLKALKEE